MKQTDENKAKWAKINEQKDALYSREYLPLAERNCLLNLIRATEIIGEEEIAIYYVTLERYLWALQCIDLLETVLAKHQLGITDQLEQCEKFSEQKK